MQKERCDACGANPTDHLSAWITNSGDMVALNFVGLRNSLPITLLSSVGERVLGLLAKLFFFIGKADGMLTLHDDVSKVLTERARVMWEEANNRGIPMKQIYVFGKPTEYYQIHIKGKSYFVDSLPIPPHLQKEVLHIDDKISFKKILREAGIPAPLSRGAGTLQTAKQILKELKNVCVKPRTGSNGRHTYPYVTLEEDLEKAFKSAKQLCALVSVEEHLEGNVCRATCVGGKMVGFLECFYPTITGDGISTVQELIDKANVKKGEDVEDIEMSETHKGYIERRGYSLSSVLPLGVSLPLIYWAGRSSGGYAKEYGRDIHESFIPLIEKAAVLTELPVVGFDIIIPDPFTPQDSQKWGFIEANSLPWINLHSRPHQGGSVNVAKYVWDLWE